jgi:hypothetical protein
VAPVSEQPQAEETSRASSLLPLCFRSASALLPLCFRSASALLPLCFHPASTLCPTGCSCSCRSSRPTSRSSSRWAPPSPPPRGKPAGPYERSAPGPRLRLSSASAPRPQRLRPSSTWRAVRVACLAPALMVAMVAPLYLPSISGAISTSSCKYGRVTPTPRRRRSAALWRSSSSSPTRPICTWTETWQTRSSDAELPTLGFESRIRWGSNHGFSNRNVWEFARRACFPTTSPFSDETLPSARRRRTYVLAV